MRLLAKHELPGTLSASSARCRRAAKLVKFTFLVSLSASLVACASGNEIPKHTLYQGKAAFVRLQDVVVAAADGSRMPFGEVFDGFTPAGFFSRTFPARTIDIRLVGMKRVRDLLAEFDANGDGWSEQPELTALYVREGARGLGFGAEHVLVDGQPARALVVPRSDIGGLLNYIYSQMAEMKPEARDLFRTMEVIGQLERQREILDSGSDAESFSP